MTRERGGARRLAATLLAVAVCATASGQETESTSARAEAFEKHVRPVLAAHCFECHGPTTQEAGLRLDSRAAVLEGGDDGPVVVPGKPLDSLLVKAIGYDGDVQMPPSGKLDSQQIAALTAWVEQGVFWPDAASGQPASGSAEAAARQHWSFQSVVRPAVPDMQDDLWSRSPLDRFILGKVRDHRLEPAGPAPRHALLRRVSFDLIGLPPSPEEVTDFLGDDSPHAWAKVIDRLLASPHYGERWGRHWLDVARYADNKGYVFFEDKNFPWAWTYRDYIVRALNEDLPYDRFIVEQLAADQLDVVDEPWRLAAMGFLTVGGRFMNNVHDILDDRIDVVTRGLLGLTVTCARCHDHKFDPVPTADYYSLYGVFRSSVEPTLPPLIAEPPETDEYRNFIRESETRLAKLDEFVTAKHTALVTSARTRAAEYLLAAHAQRDQPPTDDFMLIADPGDLNPAMTIRWQTLLDKTRRRHHPVWAAWHALSELPADRFAAESVQVLAALASATSAKPVNPLVLNELTAEPPASLSDVATRYAELFNRIDAEWQRLLADAHSAGDEPPTTLSNGDEEQLRQVFHGAEAPPDVPVTFGWGFLTLLPDRAAQDEYKKLLKEVETWMTTGPGAPPRAMVVVDDSTPHEPRIFQRGNPNRPGAAVPRQFIACIDPDREPFQHGSGRLELARAIASADNPLTARVMANRVWLQHFGTGLVTTPGDFGLRGEPPSHAELLDWLAGEFVDGQGSRVKGQKDVERWSIKRLHRAIVHSAVYQQASDSDSRPSTLDTEPSSDPENRFLARFPRRRLDFEALRDALLAVSGSLDRTIGGPPVDIMGGGFATRRTIYGSIDRLDVPGLLTTFDFPNPAASSPQRAETSVAPQALFLMNNEFSAEAARRLAARPDVSALSSIDERLSRMYLIVFGREPNDRERRLANEFLGSEPSDSAWEQLGQALLMSNEFVFVD